MTFGRRSEIGTETRRELFERTLFQSLQSELLTVRLLRQSIGLDKVQERTRGLSSWVGRISGVILVGIYSCYLKDLSLFLLLPIFLFRSTCFLVHSKKKLRQVLAIDSFFVNKDRVPFYTFGERNNANRGRKKIRWFFNREGSSPSIPNGTV